MGVRYIGAKVTRLEDKRLLTGHGRYVDDIKIPGMVHAAFLRSPHAHATFKTIDKSAAEAVPGVIGVFTQADLKGYEDKRMGQPYPSPLIKKDIVAHPLAKDEVNFVGQPVAIAIAESRHLAEDALALVEIDYEPLPAIMDCRVALDPDAPKAHVGISDNRIGTLKIGWGDVEATFRDAPHVFRATFMQHRGGCHSMETRGVVAEDKPFDGGLTIWSSTQVPYLARRIIADHLGSNENEVRVIAPDVGGGFGPKAGVYPEEIVMAILAKQLGRPIKWIEDRREHFTATNNQRDQHWDLEAATDADGKILGLRGTVINENGAFVPYGLLLCFTTLNPLPGPYAIKNLAVTLENVFTNATPNSPIRGAGRPNTAFALDRVIEAVARGLKLDPADVRRRNLVPAEAMPYPTGHKLPNGRPIVYDSGDYTAALEKALEVADYAGFKARQAEARARGKYLGIGLSSCVEDTGMGPFEGSTVRVEANGKVLLQTAAASQGQGHRTVFSQIVAEVLGVSPNDITYESADTAKFPIGVGTVASRVAVNAGTSVFSAARQVREKALKLAAEVLEAAEGDLDITDGVVHVKGAGDVKVSLGDLAKRLMPGVAGPVPKGFTPGLDATSYDSSDGLCFAYGSNVAEVEVDIETGEVKLLKYSVAHDCGTILNPLLVDGQIVGGVVHGISNALFEHMIYDEAGQPLSTNYGEYLMALATEMPRIEVAHLETPSPLNPIGVKGAGEGGTIPALAAIVNAVENALQPFGVVIDFYPMSPSYLIDLIERAEAKIAAE